MQSRYFSDSYAQARERFAAAKAVAARMASYPIEARGARTRPCPPTWR